MPYPLILQTFIIPEAGVAVAAAGGQSHPSEEALEGIDQGLTKGYSHLKHYSKRTPYPLRQPRKGQAQKGLQTKTAVKDQYHLKVHKNRPRQRNMVS